LVTTTWWKRAVQNTRRRERGDYTDVDGAAKSRGQTTYQTPVGFRVHQAIDSEDKIALSGEESAGLIDSRARAGRKGRFSRACWCRAMTAARGRRSVSEVRAMFKKLGRSFTGAGESALVRRTEGKRSSPGGNERRYDTTGKESCIGGPHGWSKIRV
jgi:hypothetical protein